MPETLDLAALFLAHTKVRLEPPPEASLLASAWERSRTQWPEVALAPELFVKHLAERLAAPLLEGSLEKHLQQLFLEDLYLACACVHEVPMALETFEQHVLRKLPRLLRHRDRSAAMIDEICQLTRVKLLVATPEGPPKLVEYMGKGALLNWVKITALRIGNKLDKPLRPPSDPDISALLEALPSPAEAPEVAVIRQYNREELRAAVQQAFSSLSAEDRYLFRLYYVERLSMYDLEPLLRISQPTISRRLKGAREKVYAETRRHLQAHLGLSPQDFQSFMKLLDSKFEWSISQLLGQGTAPGPNSKSR